MRSDELHKTRDGMSGGCVACVGCDEARREENKGGVLGGSQSGQARESETEQGGGEAVKKKWRRGGQTEGLRVHSCTHSHLQ